MNPLLMVWNFQEVAVKPFTRFYNEILMFLEASGSFCESLFMVWDLQELAVKPFARFSNEIFMVVEASGGCCESIIDGLESRGGCREAICIFFIMKYCWFWKLQEAAVNPLLMVWNLQEVAAKPFIYFYNEIIVVL